MSLPSENSTTAWRRLAGSGSPSTLMIIPVSPSLVASESYSGVPPPSSVASESSDAKQAVPVVVNNGVQGSHGKKFTRLLGQLPRARAVCERGQHHEIWRRHVVQKLLGGKYPRVGRIGVRDRCAGIEQQSCRVREPAPGDRQFPGHSAGVAFATV